MFFATIMLPIASGMHSFVHNALPARVVFGSGTSKSAIAKEVQNLGCKRAILVTGRRGKADGEAVMAALPQEVVAGIYAKAVEHTPEDVTKDALRYAESVSADCAIAVGGGSAIGLAKALALHSNGRIKQIAIPTTYSGSETTAILGQKKDGVKNTQKSLLVVPHVIIYDVDLTLGLPAKMTTTSGINAIAHAVEALYAEERSPIIETMALQGIKSLADALPRLAKNLEDLEARSDALYGAWTCGTCLGSASMGLHHKICHVLGGSFGLPHAEVHTVILPHSAAYNTPYAQEPMRRIAETLGASSAASGLYDLAKNNGAPYSLKELGMKEEDLEKAADIAVKTPYPNPGPLVREKLLHMLQNAYNGVRPE